MKLDIQKVVFDSPAQVIQDLLNAIDDLWGCIGAEEAKHLDQETREMAQDVHEYLWHSS